MATASVWDRRGESTMSANLYVSMITWWTALGMAVSAVAAYWSLSWRPSALSLWLAVLVGLAGAAIAAKSESPAVSVGGYMMLAASLGLTTGPYVAHYSAASVTRIMTLTCSVVVSLGAVGAIIPDRLGGWGSWLLGGLLVLLAGLVLLPLLSLAGLPIGGMLTFWDWLGIALFSGYVVYDVNRALRIPYTMDNSIDSAVQIYLDLVNLFIRLLALFGDDD
jgi:FtsH-binding integral membrane protein